MNRNEFNRFIAGIDLPGPGDLEGLKELTALFPWFHSAHLLLLRGLKENSDIRFDSQLKSSALSVNDREVLYHYLFNTTAEVADGTISVEQAAVAESVVDPETWVPEAVVESLTEPEAVAPEMPEEVAAEISVVTPDEVADEEHIGEPELITESVPGPEASAPEVLEEVALDPDVYVDITGAIVEPSEEDHSVEPVSISEVKAEAEHAVNEVVYDAVYEAHEAVPYAEAAIPEAAPVAAAAAPESVPEEEAAAPESVVAIPETQVDANYNLRTKEELIAEIEARLNELKAGLPETWNEEKHAPDPPEEIATFIEPEYEAEPEEFTAVTEPEHQVEPVAQENTGSEAEDEELLELLPDSVTEQDTTRKSLSPTDLIDRFIMISPTIERMSPKEYKQVRDLDEESEDEAGKFITETLAKIYVTQGYFSKAINIYEKLSLQYPEKSAYFASRIEKIKDLIK